MWTTIRCGTPLRKRGKWTIICAIGKRSTPSRRRRRKKVAPLTLKTDALIVRENKVGEADRFVTALTRESGLVRAAARGAKNIKSRKGAATSLLTYSRLTLTETKSGLSVSEAEPLRVFFDWKSDVTAVTLGQYFCELCGVLAPWDEPAEDVLRLMLNALHLLSEGKKDPRLVKAAVEWRLLTLAGYMPDLSACRRCGGTENLSLSLQNGTLTCAACGVGLDCYPLSETGLAALRYLSTAPGEKVFSFAVPEAELTALSAVCERFLLYRLNRGFHTLDFYHQLCDFEPKPAP